MTRCSKTDTLSLMSRVQTPKEVRQSYINSMGKELGTVYYVLWQEISHLHFKWNEYLGLFGTEKRIALLNQSASGCFKVLQDALWRDILLHICRLTDPPEMGGKANLKTNMSIRRLPALVEVSLKQNVIDLVDQVLVEAKDIRDRRNLIMAHMDLEWALDEEGVVKLPKTNRENVEACLAGLVLLLNFFSQKYRDTQLIFDGARLRNGAEGLLYVLHYGVAFQKERRARIKAGKSKPDDLLPPPWF